MGMQTIKNRKMLNIEDISFSGYDFNILKI